MNKLILGFFSLLLAASFTCASQDVLNRKNFKLVWKYDLQPGFAGDFNHRARGERVMAFADALDAALTAGATQRFGIVLSPGARFSLDRSRSEIKLGSDGDFDTKQSLEKVCAAFGVPYGAKPPVKDYFGSPAHYRGGYIMSYIMNGRFYLEYMKNEKPELLLEESQYFDSLKTYDERGIFYRLQGSLWYIDINRKRNFCYFPPRGRGTSGYGSGFFLKSYDVSDGRVALALTAGGQSDILLGSMREPPDFFFQKLPYTVNDIFVVKNRLFFTASVDKKKTIVAVASIKKKSILKLFSFTGKVLPVCKYKNGLVLFFPRRGRLEYVDAHRAVHLYTKLKVKKLRDDYGVKYLIAEKEKKLAAGIRQTLLTGPSRNVLFLEDVNHLNFVYKNVSSKDYYSFCPVSANEYILLEISGSVRRFYKYRIEGLLTRKELLRQRINGRRKMSMAVLIFFIAALVILQGVKNAEKKKKIFRT